MLHSVCNCIRSRYLWFREKFMDLMTSFQMSDLAALRQTCFRLWMTESWWRHEMETFSALLALCAGNSPVTGEFPHKGQWRGALMFSWVCARTNPRTNTRDAGDLRRHYTHYDITVMQNISPCWSKEGSKLNIQKCGCEQRGYYFHSESFWDWYYIRSNPPSSANVS